MAQLYVGNRLISKGIGGLYGGLCCKAGVGFLPDRVAHRYGKGETRDAGAAEGIRRGC
jgi:hypothetical protein